METNVQSKRITALLLVMMLTFALFAPSAAAESFTAEVTVNKMTVRSGPNPSYDVIATLTKGKQVTVLSYSNGIAYISFDGLKGYAPVSNMKKVSSSSPSTGGSSLSGIGTVKVSRAKIYSSASTSANVIYTAKKGQSFTVLSTDGTWAKLQNGSYTGYTLISNLDISSSVTATPTATVKPTENVNVEPPPTGLATISKNDTKIYASASTSSKVYMTLGKGATFTILNMTDTWVKLQNGKYEGYVLRSRVTVQPGVTATPAVTSTPTPKPTATPANVSNMTAVGIGKVDVNLLYIYTAPDASSSKLTSIAKGKSVIVYSHGGGWALVQYGTYVGYVKFSGLAYYENSSIPVTPTPTPNNGTISETTSMPVITNCSAPIYKTQSTSSTKLKTLAIGTELTVLGFNDNWGLVKYGSTKGYMQLGALARISSITMSPDMNAKATVSASSAVFYKYASSSSAKVGSLSKGTEVTILASDGTWALVQYKTNTGYCTLSSLSEVQNPTITQNESVACIVTSSSPLYQYASTSSNKLISNVNKDTSVTMLGHNSSWALVTAGGKTGYMTISSLNKLKDVSLEADEAYTATVTAAGTVRKYMYSGSGSAGTVPQGMKVNVLAHNTTWALIERSGNKGYYPISSLQIQLDEFTSPTVKTFDVTVIQNASVYSKASASSSKLGTLSQGTDVTVTAYTNKWVRINYGGGTAYALKSQVSNVSYTTLKSGSSSSSDILKLQKALENLGYFDGLPAGNYGSLTTNAVSRFQTQVGMNATGTADQSTLRVLYGGYAPQSTIKSASLSKGSTGTNVTRLQTRLTYKGYLSAGIDGDYGNLTQSAVKLYQKVAGLTETGDADAGTLSSLFSSSAPKNTGSAITGTTHGGSTGGSGTGSYSTNPADDPSPGTASDKIEKVINTGLQQLGKTYVYGTSGPNTFDCSGFTTYCYRQVGVSLGRSAYAQGYGKGTKIETVGELRRGDIVCMNTLTDSDLSDHVGLYLGGGKFIHASSAAGKVIISSITSGYYNRVFSWGRRVV